jgi:DNA-directed RNA polymerase specialized sigma subunit
MDMISSMSKKVTLSDLFPNMSEQQIDEISELLHGYCSTVWRIYQRLEREHPKVIDDLIKTGNMKAKVDSSKNTN